MRHHVARGEIYYELFSGWLPSWLETPAVGAFGGNKCGPRRCGGVAVAGPDKAERCPCTRRALICSWRLNGGVLNMSITSDGQGKRPAPSEPCQFMAHLGGRCFSPSGDVLATAVRMSGSSLLIQNVVISPG